VLECPKNEWKMNRNKLQKILEVKMDEKKLFSRSEKAFQP
jgi:hypothetical protein